MNGPLPTRHAFESRSERHRYVLISLSTRPQRKTIVNIGNLKFNLESFQVEFQGIQWKPMKTLET